MTGHHHSRPGQRASGAFWTSRAGMALIVFLGAAGLLLGYEHRAHMFTGTGVLIGLLGLCIVMHVFMHGGHGGHGGDDSDTEPGDRP